MSRDARAFVPLAAARRLFLHAQGLLDDPARRATPAAVFALVRRLGFVQIDSIPVVERAHHLILAARLDGYRPPLLTRLVERDRKLFEHWTHDAAFIPTDWFPYWHARFERAHHGIRRNKWWQERLGADYERAAADMLAHIRSAGPVTSKDFQHDRRGEPAGWWGWKPQKALLEYLWHTGALAVARREQFQKVYDLMERVHPAEVAQPPASDASDYMPALDE